MEDYKYLIAGISWVIYGILCFLQMETEEDKLSDAAIILFLLNIAFSPLIFIGRALFGAFKWDEKKNKL